MKSHLNSLENDDSANSGGCHGSIFLHFEMGDNIIQKEKTDGVFLGHGIPCSLILQGQWKRMRNKSSETSCGLKENTGWLTLVLSKSCLTVMLLTRQSCAQHVARTQRAMQSLSMVRLCWSCEKSVEKLEKQMQSVVVRQTNPSVRTLITVSEITIGLPQLHLYRAGILGPCSRSPTQLPKIRSPPSLSLDKSFYITAVFQVSSGAR